MDYLSEYRRWCDNVTDSELAADLAVVKGNTQAIEERFYSGLSFGTAGLRGIMRAGSSAMNIYTVMQATQGLADYINNCFGGGSVAVSYDTRHKSELFARTAAAVFCANGIKTHIYRFAAPTPMLSFAVRSLECCMGVMITASHNPAEYNGYKVYGSDGCQIGVSEAAAVSAYIDKTDCFAVKQAACTDNGLPENAEYINDRVTQRYYQSVLACAVEPSARMGKLSVVYTPLHGTGLEHVVKLLEHMGVEKLSVVECQREPDGDFTTCEYPNPETQAALQKGIEQLLANHADILLATDPDADRVGVAVRTGDDVRILTGNEVGVLLLDFIVNSRKAHKTMPENPVAVKSLVSTSLADEICAAAGVEMRTVLTGFKNIGEQILLLEQQGGQQRFIFGFEESCGYLSGGYVRDKDAMNACMLLCELAATLKKSGKTMCDVLNSLAEKHGYFLTKTLNFEFDGLDGLENMKRIMSQLRQQAPATLAGTKVVFVDDYLSRTSRNLLTGGTEAITMEKSDIVEFRLADGCKLLARPSGTEPKLKIYLTAHCPTSEAAAQRMQALCEAAEALASKQA